MALLFGSGPVWLCFFTVYTGALVLVLVACCGDPDRPDSLGHLVRWAGEIPEHIAGLLRRVTPALLYARGAVWVDYVAYERNPVCQIIYLGLVNGGFGAALVWAFPMVPCSTVPEHHRAVALAAFGLCLASFVKVSTTEPGYVTDAVTEAAHDNYPFDGLLYEEGRFCTTGKVRKLARSKFCRVSRCNVARFDHFCPWLNVAVGEENHRWFLAFLACHAGLLGYGTFATVQLLREVCLREELWTAVFFHSRTRERTPATFSIIAYYLFATQTPLCCLLALCAVMGVVVAAFFAFHLWLVSRNLTSNEFYKRLALAKRQPWDDDAPVGCVSASTGTTAQPPPSRVGGGGGGCCGGGDGDDVVVVGEKQHIIPPGGPKKDDTSPSRDAPRHEGPAAAAAARAPKTSRRRALLPRHAYDKGSFFANLGEVLAPLSKRPAARRRARSVAALLAAQNTSANEAAKATGEAPRPPPATAKSKKKTR